MDKIAGVRSQEPGVRSQEPGARSQESGVRSQDATIESKVAVVSVLLKLLVVTNIWSKYDYVDRGVEL